jgi:hypothetical protein
MRKSLAGLTISVSMLLTAGALMAPAKLLF